MACASRQGGRVLAAQGDALAAVTAAITAMEVAGGWVCCAVLQRWRVTEPHAGAIMHRMQPLAMRGAARI